MRNNLVKVIVICGMLTALVWSAGCKRGDSSASGGTPAPPTAPQSANAAPMPPSQGASEASKKMGDAAVAAGRGGKDAADNPK